MFHSNCVNESRDWSSDSDNMNTNPCVFKQYLSNYVKSESWSQIIYNIELDLRYLNYSVIFLKNVIFNFFLRLMKKKRKKNSFFFVVLLYF
jgi:hypothetical protein